MPNLVVYIPANTWRAFERKEGAAAKEVARVLIRQLIDEYANSAPGGLAPSQPSGASGTRAVTASSGSGAEN